MGVGGEGWGRITCPCLRRKELVAEYGRGELCGIVETLTGAKRSTTLLAVRWLEELTSTIHLHSLSISCM